MAVPDRLVMVGSPPRPGSPPATPWSGDQRVARRLEGKFGEKAALAIAASAHW